MNFGDCPYPGCKGFLQVFIPDVTPAYTKLDCPECGKPVWYRVSRVDPTAYTEENFLKCHTIDEVNKSIEEKPEP